MERGLLTEFQVPVTSRNRLGFNAVMGSTHGCTRRLMNRVYFGASALRSAKEWRGVLLRYLHRMEMEIWGFCQSECSAETSLDGEERSFFHLDGLITGTNLNGTRTLNGVSSSRYLSPQPTWL
ncbi:hypothetical protein CEXT_794111 [Caerostris extrusa]|uniref:Uncharacterized protein n=1 Tax=Caerostris extrusa TaxID=172846 RepID=A0AAV4U553_CAEEX|nr:hypothetical protein CEXT_794111 [Caerostris extrusa]